jgi:ribosomal protein S18 acetylase RimI-like enzyme
MDLRPVADGEEAELFEIHRAVFRSHIEQLWGWDERWQRSNFAAELASSTTSVIRMDALIVGYVQFRDEVNRIYVQNIALLPDFQCKGIGTRLMNELQTKAAARGVPLELGVFRTNAPARRFYERLGFERTRDTETHTEMSWRAC